MHASASDTVGLSLVLTRLVRTIVPEKRPDGWLEGGRRQGLVLQFLQYTCDASTAKLKVANMAASCVHHSCFCLQLPNSSTLARRFDQVSSVKFAHSAADTRVRAGASKLAGTCVTEPAAELTIRLGGKRLPVHTAL